MSGQEDAGEQRTGDRDDSGHDAPDTETVVEGACRGLTYDVGRGGPTMGVELAGDAERCPDGLMDEVRQPGLITREDAPPPVATVLYTLTEDGLALEPVLKSLGLWGLRFMTVERPDDAFQARWLAYAPAWFITDADPDASPAVIQVVASDESAVIELRGGQIHTRLGRATDPDLVLDGPPRAVLGLLTGVIDLKLASQLGLSVRGRRDLLTRLRPVAQDRTRTQDVHHQ
ncbi:transcriptional regulator [Streptomyces sp. NPDC001795]|uniref:winged helix-turn-helix transcriptional regulator n=1 Tax=unclassified Streptomyces TaxID=2593676 RepID=UPI003332AE84